MLRIAIGEQICLPAVGQPDTLSDKHAAQVMCRAHGLSVTTLPAHPESVPPGVSGDAGTKPAGPIVTCLSSLDGSCAQPDPELDLVLCLQALAALRDVVAAPLRRARGDRLGRLREGLQRPAGRGTVLGGLD